MQGHFELNVFRPVVVSNMLNSIQLISSASVSFEKMLSKDLIPNYKRISELMSQSLMLVTALNPYIGYSKAAQIAKYAHKKGITLKEAALDLKILTSDQFDEYVKPEKMISPSD